MTYQYQVAVISPTAATTGKGLAENIQTVIESHAENGWRFVSMVNVFGIGSFSKMGIGPYLLLVFETEVTE